MVTEEHQRLVNALALVLEDQRRVRITAIDVAGTPEYFEQKYRNLPKPSDYDGSIPDLEGMNANNTVHLGEAETYMEAENLDVQLQRFSSRVMRETNAPVPLHVIVPERIRSQMESRIRSLGLDDKLNGRRITLWHVKD